MLLVQQFDLQKYIFHDGQSLIIVRDRQFIDIFTCVKLSKKENYE